MCPENSSLILGPEGPVAVLTTLPGLAICPYLMFFLSILPWPLTLIDLVFTIDSVHTRVYDIDISVSQMNKLRLEWD